MNEWVTSRIRDDNGLKVLEVKIEDYKKATEPEVARMVSAITSGWVYAEALAIEATPFSAGKMHKSLKKMLQDWGASPYKLEYQYKPRISVWMYFLYPSGDETGAVV